MSPRKAASVAPIESALARRCRVCDAPPGVGCVTAPHSLGTRHPLRKPHRARADAPPPDEEAYKLLSARVTMVIDGSDGPRTVEVEAQPDLLAHIESALTDGGPTADEAADVAQRLAELRLVLLRADRTLLEPVDAAAGLLSRLPGVAAELERRRLGSRR